MSAKWFHRRCFIEGIQTEEYSDVPLAKIMPQHFDGWENLDKAEVTGRACPACLVARARARVCVRECVRECV